jgi:hypothetical protein
MSFTGNKDTDFLVLNQLLDNDLASVCSANKYAKKLCEDEGFWKRRLFSNSIISNLEKEYLDVGRVKDFYENIVSLKIFLEFETWKELYIFFFSGDRYQQENLKELLRNSIVRLEQNHSQFLEDLEKMDELKNVPKWINVDELKKDIVRKYFWKLSRPISVLKYQLEEDFKKFLRDNKSQFKLW